MTLRVLPLELSWPPPPREQVDCHCHYPAVFLKHSSGEDVNTAVEAAHSALKSWSGLSGFDRAKHLYSIARHVQKHARSEHIFVIFVSDK